MNKHQQGFTLIELMIVVAIIGILAAIAVPAYQNYLNRAKLTEATALLAASKAAITEAYNSGGNKFPLTANAPIPTDAPLNAKYITAVNYTSAGAGTASVVLTLDNTGEAALDTKFLGLMAVGNTDGTVSWTCATAKATTDVAAGAVTAMYPFLPAA